ncbi:hypothetical protein CBR_g12662 [Chara braunii]|uniref:Uncharacterized protein n=1 Tax=Chara braunii TaxID=69332 RepID=A0A388KS93_CHABU|nr:hypothetical protein CBR_g12662 [Chara braunii]|eukprot:GBG72940.1 hypothetical protein CBR_g12662 [Chara braunii]
MVGSGGCKNGAWSNISTSEFPKRVSFGLEVTCVDKNLVANFEGMIDARVVSASGHASLGVSNAFTSLAKKRIHLLYPVIEGRAFGVGMDLRWTEKVLEHRVHSRLESGGGVTETERHDGKLVVHETRTKSGLGLVLLGYADLVISVTKIDLREEMVAGEAVKQVIRARHGIAIFDRVVVQTAIVNTETKDAVLLAIEEDRGSPWGSTRFNEALAKQLLKLALEFLGFGNRKAIRDAILNAIVWLELDVVLDTTHGRNAAVGDGYDPCDRVTGRHRAREVLLEKITKLRVRHARVNALLSTKGEKVAPSGSHSTDEAGRHLRRPQVHVYPMVPKLLLGCGDPALEFRGLAIELGDSVGVVPRYIRRGLVMRREGDGTLRQEDRRTRGTRRGTRQGRKLGQRAVRQCGGRWRKGKVHRSGLCLMLSVDERGSRLCHEVGRKGLTSLELADVIMGQDTSSGKSRGRSQGTKGSKSASTAGKVTAAAGVVPASRKAQAWMMNVPGRVDGPGAAARANLEMVIRGDKSAALRAKNDSRASSPKSNVEDDDSDGTMIAGEDDCGEERVEDGDGKVGQMEEGDDREERGQEGGDDGGGKVVEDMEGCCGGQALGSRTMLHQGRPIKASAKATTAESAADEEAVTDGGVPSWDAASSSELEAAAANREPFLLLRPFEEGPFLPSEGAFWTWSLDSWSRVALPKDRRSLWP